MSRPRAMAAFVALLLLLGTPARAVELSRFFFAGNGHLVLRHAYFDTTLDVRYRRGDGSYDAAALSRIDHFFRSREDGREAPVSLRLIELLSYVQNRFHPRQMVLLSGYRSPEFNGDLRNAGRAAAQASLHTEAMAADILFAGTDMGRLWRQLRELGVGGVGYYRQNKFLHVDTGPARFWEASTSRVQENLSAENARIFVRTDFDRYPRLQGAVCTLHSVTAFPVWISPRATLVDGAGSHALAVQPANGTAAQTNGCFAVEPGVDTHAFRVTTVAEAAGDGPTPRTGHVVLSTCEPRLGKTAMELESNRIEIAPAGERLR